MANTVLIMGESGTGKSTSLRNLEPKETSVINVLDKPLPFKGFAKNYIRANSALENGNYFASDNAAQILKRIEFISKKQPAIKNLIIDDFQYIMANEFMRQAKVKGFEKFIEIGQSAWSIIQYCTAARPDLYIFILSHTETDATGKSKCKTIGKMLDDKITLEGMFTVVLHSLICDRHYKFLTQNDNTHIAKSPMGMFTQSLIDNDLLEIKKCMVEYFDDNQMPPPSPPKQEEDSELKKDFIFHCNLMRESSDLDELAIRFNDATITLNKHKNSIATGKLEKLNREMIEFLKPSEESK